MRRAANGVRTPHQKRSLPSTKTTGVDAFEDVTMSFIEWVRLTRGEHDVDISRSNRLELQLGIACHGIGVHVFDPEASEHRRAVALATHCHPGSPPDRDECTNLRCRGRRERLNVRARRAHRIRQLVEGAGHVGDIVDLDRVNVDSLGVESLGILESILLGAHDDDIR